MNLGRRHEFREAGFDLTPMIDVILLLLTFFVMGSQFAQAMRKPMDLPQQTGEPPASDAARAIVVDMDSIGALHLLDGQAVTRPEFVSLVRTEMDVTTDGKAREIELTIRADRACPSLHLNKLAADLARIGVRKWKVATKGGLGGGVGVKPEGSNG